MDRARAEDSVTVVAPGRAKALELARQVGELKGTEDHHLDAARSRLESGFFHSEEGLRALADHLVQPSE